MKSISVWMGAGVLALSGLNDTVEAAVKDKTLIAWVTVSDLEQRGGSVLTIEKSGGIFDGIVFGEITPRKWMAGSDGFQRTQKAQEQVPIETAERDKLLQVAVVYAGLELSIYRDGQRLTKYSINEAEQFDDDAMILMGLRHTDAAPENRYFAGSIEDARVYDRVLSAEEITTLRPNVASEPRPVAWWDFEKGGAGDQMNSFRSTTLVGGARIADGRLWLETPGAFLLGSRSEAGVGRDPVETTARALREKLLSDPHRPGYHFVIPEGQAMPFDPNGAIFWKGRYHLFYIFQDKRGHNWGHVSSTDLFHWRQHPTGLVSGMFSGNCFINAEGRPTMCYHQVGQGNAMAVALDDELNEWKKLDSNPITPKTQPGAPHHDKYRSWDPFGWYEGGTYYAIFGGERPAIAKSPKLEAEWKYVGDLMANGVDGVSINEDVSCADFFPIGNQHMLLCISHRLGCRYYLGEWKDEQFHPKFHEKMSWVDNSFFAPESLLDDRGRRIMWAWIFDYPEFKMRTDFGWSGTMSLPRVLSVGIDGRLRMQVTEEIERLRYDARTKKPMQLTANTDLTIEDVKGSSLELIAEFAPSDAKQVGLKVCCSPDGSEETLVYYDAEEKKLKIDTTRASLSGRPKAVEAGPFELATGETLQLRIFIDKSVVEVFANSRQAVMRRIYPSRPDSLEVKAFARGGPAKLNRLSAWEMMPSNPY